MLHVLGIIFFNPQEGMLLPPVVEARYTDFTPRFTQSFLPQVILWLWLCRFIWFHIVLHPIFSSSIDSFPPYVHLKFRLHNAQLCLQITFKEQPAQFHNLFHSLRTWLPTNSKYVKVHDRTFESSFIRSKVLAMLAVLSVLAVLALLSVLAMQC